MFLVDSYAETRSYKTVQNRFREQFPDRDVPAKSTILRNVNKYNNFGTSLNLNQHSSDRSCSARNAENIETVRTAIEENPRLSARWNGTGLSSATFNRITRLDLNLHPYVMRTRHGLHVGDFQRRENYSQWFVEKCGEEFYPKHYNRGRSGV